MVSAYQNPAQQKFLNSRCEGPKCQYSHPLGENEGCQKWKIHFFTFWQLIRWSSVTKCRDMVILHTLQQPILSVCFLWLSNSNMQFSYVAEHGDKLIIKDVINWRDILKNVVQRFRATVTTRQSCRFEIGGHKDTHRIGCCNGYRFRCHLKKLDPPALKWPHLWHLSTDSKWMRCQSVQK